MIFSLWADSGASVTPHKVVTNSHQPSSNLEYEVTFSPEEKKMLMGGTLIGFVVASMVWIAVYCLKVKPDFEDTCSCSYSMGSNRYIPGIQHLSPHPP